MAKNTVKLWTKREMDLIRSGKPNKEIASITGRTPAQVSVKKAYMAKKGEIPYSSSKTNYTTKDNSVNSLKFLVDGVEIGVENTAKSIFVSKKGVTVNFN